MIFVNHYEVYGKIINAVTSLQYPFGWIVWAATRGLQLWFPAIAKLQWHIKPTKEFGGFLTSF
jgi:hypothetical protein